MTECMMCRKTIEELTKMPEAVSDVELDGPAMRELLSPKIDFEGKTALEALTETFGEHEAVTILVRELCARQIELEAEVKALRESEFELREELEFLSPKRGRDE